MNKHEAKRKIEQLQFALDEKTKEFDYLKGEFGRVKKAYKMSEQEIRQLKQDLSEKRSNK